LILKCSPHASLRPFAIGNWIIRLSQWRWVFQQSV